MGRSTIRKTARQYLGHSLETTDPRGFAKAHIVTAAIPGIHAMLDQRAERMINDDERSRNTPATLGCDNSAGSP
jgi:hypothetical protein